MTVDGELRGIGGWLAAFLVTLGIITPASTVIATAGIAADAELAANYGSVWTELMVLEWTVAGFTVVAAWTVVWHFFNVRQWRTVRIAIGLLWLFAAIATVGEPLGVALLSGIPLGELVASAPVDFIRPLVYSSIWTAYLLKSERVANTYPVYAADEELAGTFE